MQFDSRGSLFACIFFMMCTLHRNIPLYVLFSFMCFKQIFISFRNFFLMWSLRYSPLGFACIEGGEISKFKSRKIGENLLLVLFFSKGTIIFAKGMKQNNVKLSRTIFEKHLQFGTLYWIGKHIKIESTKDVIIITKHLKLYE